jgi:hypothetical protein
MEGLGFEALAVLLVLLPGFLAAKLVHSFCFRPDQSDFDKVVEALIYSFVAYVTFIAIFKNAPVFVIQWDLPDSSHSYSLSLNALQFVYLLLIAITLALLVSLSITNDLHMRLARLLKFTERTSRPTIWNDVFYGNARFVQVQFVDGRKIIGEILFFSDTPEEASLFLENAAWIGEDNSTTDIPGPGILITKNMPIETIMFLKSEKGEVS